MTQEARVNRIICQGADGVLRKHWVCGMYTWSNGFRIFLCIGLLVVSSVLLWGCGECRHDADCSSGGLCLEGKCEEQKIKPPPPRQECITSERRDCYSGPEGTANRGICKAGTQTCENSAWSVCRGETRPAEEKCDGLDNNCDGQVDEGCGCQDGNTQTCYTGNAGTQKKGECADGTQTCADGVWGTCLGQKLPQAEECDNKDNDCNGLVDDGVAKKCQNKCGLGEEICRNGKFEPCNAPQPVKEVCGDGKDNDCNGSIDEGCECTPNKVRDCYSGPAGTEGQGPCVKGVQSCSADGKWLECNGQELPKHEQCNNRDDDCNGAVDDNIKRPCSRGCNSGQEFCQAGQWQGCNAAPADPEICDGKDNDCNGKVDDLAGGGTCECSVGQSETCYTGPTGTVNVGPCLSGKRTCQSTGKWSICLQQVLPAVEDCDGKDNDCDGQIDNQKGAATALSKPCYSGTPGTDGKGLCREGVQRCNGGSWSTCTGEITPTTEVCDNKDNDCNGKIDDGLTQSCYSGAAGTDGKGLCKQGSKTCTQGVWSSCVGEITPSPERCNQKDDDCDGQTDEGGVCNVCNNGQTQPCYTGPSSSRGLTPCKDGTQTCVGGQWGTCAGEVTPKGETCNNKDDNCDGIVDNGLTRQCSSQCGVGTEICSAGQWINCNAPTPQTEICNNKDDDCDGQTDEGLQCSILATGDWDGNVHTWNPYSKTKLRSFKLTSSIYSVAFSPDGTLGIGAIGNFRMYDPNTGTQKASLTHTGKIRGLAFSKDNQFVATGSDDNKVIIWNRTTNASVRTLTHTFSVRSLAYNDTGSLLAAGNGTRVSFWNANTGSLASSLSMPYDVYSIAISPNGKSMLVAGTGASVPKLELWDISATPYTRTITFNPSSCQVVVYHTTFSPDGSRATAACPDAAYVWNISTQQKLVEVKKSGTWFYAAALTPDNQTLAIGGRVAQPGHLFLFDVSTATPTQTLHNTSDHSNYLWTLAFR